MITQLGDLTASVQRLVVVGCRRENERVPIHHRQTEGTTAMDWDPTFLAGNATIRSVQVYFHILYFFTTTQSAESECHRFEAAYDNVISGGLAKTWQLPEWR